MNDLRTRLQLIYNTTDITQEIQQFVESVDFTDSLDKADDLQINLTDDGRLWIRTWSPKKGATLTCTIYQSINGSETALPCGVFHIDTVGLSGKTVSIKATSADFNVQMRKENHTRHWENVSLSRVLLDVATGAGLTLDYMAKADPVYARIEQKGEADIAFCERIAKAEDLMIKVYKGKLIVISASAYEQNDAIMRLSIDDERIISRDIEYQIVDEYSAVAVKYRHPRENKVHEYTYKIPGAKADAPTLHINRRCESPAQAERLAKAALGQNNRVLTNGNITMIGSPSVLAGSNIELDSTWGVLAGKYSLPEVHHALWPYITGISLKGIYSTE